MASSHGQADPDCKYRCKGCSRSVSWRLTWTNIGTNNRMLWCVRHEPDCAYVNNITSKTLPSFAIKINIGSRTKIKCGICKDKPATKNLTFYFKVHFTPLHSWSERVCLDCYKMVKAAKPEWDATTREQPSVLGDYPYKDKLYEELKTVLFATRLVK